MLDKIKDCEVGIKVHKVNLNIYENERLKTLVEAKEKSINYLLDENIKLKRKLDNQESFGLNCLLFTFEELVGILKNRHHPLHEYIWRWFGDDPDDDYEYLYFSEDGIEVSKGDYWLVNIKEDYATTFDDIDRLNRKIYELEKVE